MPKSNDNNIATITLREITQETVRSILDLDVTEEQKKFVASNARSIAEAHFAESVWFRAIYADEKPVGFLPCHWLKMSTNQYIPHLNYDM